MIFLYLYLTSPATMICFTEHFIWHGFLFLKQTWYDNVPFSEFKVFFVVLKELTITEF